MTTGVHWHKSSYSGQESNCVEVADDRGHRHVRDSKLSDASPTLTFTTTAWHTFLTTRPTRR